MMVSWSIPLAFAMDTKALPLSWGPLEQPRALNVGNPGKMMTKAERPAPNSIRLTDMLMGKVTQVSTYTVSPDGGTLNAEWMDPRNDSRGSFVAKRQ